MPIKINCVTMRGTNDDEFVEFAKLSLRRAVTVRFIEYMPLGDAAPLRDVGDMRAKARTPMSDRRAGFRLRRAQSSRPHEHSVSSDELGPAAGCGAQDRGAGGNHRRVRSGRRIESSLGPFVPIDRDLEAGVGPAIPYRLSGGNPLGRIAFISAMSQPFCRTCNRLRLTANGVLRSCLFEGGEVEIRSILRSEDSPAVRRASLATAMSECVRLKPDVHSAHGNQQMSRIGG